MIDLEKYPFLSLVKVIDTDKEIIEYVGIILNKSKRYTGIYILDQVKNKEKFLSLGKVWWEESNHKMPISLFLKEFDEFHSSLLNIENRLIKEVIGPETSLLNFSDKKIKRTTIKFE